MNHRRKPFLHRPWIIETLCFFLVLWQEAFRLEARTAQRHLPVSRRVRDFYYFHFGDFANGFAIAYLLDGVANYVLSSRLASGATPITVLGVGLSTRRLTLVATVLSCACITALELGLASASTTSDIADIPAGLAGALVYWLIRTAVHGRQCRETSTG